ncbi:MAG: 5-oxoprolinase subunit PxpA [Pseudomonadota bacterium]
MARSIDLNADIGEGFDDKAILPFISSCNIACGGHTGDRETVAATIKLALAEDVAIGAHPSYPDKEGFGRRSLDIEPKTLRISLIEQLELIKSVAETLGAAVGHIKPHGALYNDAVDSSEKANALLVASSEVFPGAIVTGAPFGVLKEQAETLGHPYRAEGFADRQYLDDGRLMPRSERGAVIANHDRQAAQAISLAEGRGATGPSGNAVPLFVDTLCLHSDTEGAAEGAQIIYEALTGRGITIKVPQL